MSNMNVTRLSSQRVTGLLSGMDVDEIVKNMLVNQQARLNKATQQRELINWKKDSYRSVISTLTDFQNKFLDILNPSSIMKPSNFSAMTTSAPSYASEYFSVSASNGSTASSLTVNKITNLATAQTIETLDGHNLTNTMMRLKDSDVESLAGKSLNFMVNGVTKSITISSDIANTFNADPDIDSDMRMTALVDDINAKLKSAFGTTGGVAKISIETDGVLDANGNRTMNLSILQGNTVQVTGAVDVTTKLGFAGSIGNYMDMNTAIAGQPVRFSINGKEFNFSVSAKIKDIMAEVNKSDAGVTVSYSSLNNKFILTAKETGSGDNIILKDLPIETKDADGNLTSSVNTSFLSKLFGTETDGSGASVIGKNTYGDDAVLTVNGVEIVRSSNNVTIDGMTINLLKTTGADFQPATVSSKIDSDKIMDTIKTFINEYNTLIENLNNIVSEKRPKIGQSSGYYLPLTEEQKSAMNEKDIASWEESGKKGLLYNDSTIMRMVQNLKSAMLYSLEIQDENGRKISLASIGIKSASYFEDSSGKLQIDEDKLRQAIENDPNAVMKLFTQQSLIPKDAELKNYMNGTTIKTEEDLQKVRYNTTGIAQRFSEIFYNNLNISVSEESRGSLIRIAGTGGQNYLVDYESSLQKSMANADNIITRIQNKLYADEEKYYKKFAALETALAKLSQQSSYITGLEQ